MSAQLTRTIALDDITPQECASIFAHYSDLEQAAFFAEVGSIARSWPGAGWCQQSCSIAARLDDLGRETIATLAGHAADRVTA